MKSTDIISEPVRVNPPRPSSDSGAHDVGPIPAPDDQVDSHQHISDVKQSTPPTSPSNTPDDVAKQPNNQHVTKSKKETDSTKSLAIVATVVIVLGLSALAVIAFLNYKK